MPYFVIPPSRRVIGDFVDDPVDNYKMDSFYFKRVRFVYRFIARSID